MYVGRGKGELNNAVLDIALSDRKLITFSGTKANSNSRSNKRRKLSQLSLPTRLQIPRDDTSFDLTRHFTEPDDIEQFKMHSKVKKVFTNNIKRKGKTSVKDMDDYNQNHQNNQNYQNYQNNQKQNGNMNKSVCSKSSKDNDDVDDDDDHNNDQNDNNQDKVKDGSNNINKNTFDPFCGGNGRSIGVLEADHIARRSDSVGSNYSNDTGLHSFPTSISSNPNDSTFARLVANTKIPQIAVDYYFAQKNNGYTQCEIVDDDAQKNVAEIDIAIDSDLELILNHDHNPDTNSNNTMDNDNEYEDDISLYYPLILAVLKKLTTILILL